LEPVDAIAKVIHRPEFVLAAAACGARQWALTTIDSDVVDAYGGCEMTLPEGADLAGLMQLQRRADELTARLRGSEPFST
jgi:hypothetical protein